MRGTAAGLGVTAVLLMVSGLRTVKANESAASPEFYTTKVQPILEKNCYSCHGGMNHRGGFNMATREAMLKGGHHGAGLVPGDTTASWLVRLMRHEGPADDPMNMPPAPRPKVSDADIATVEQWVKAGAIMPPDAPKP